MWSPHTASTCDTARVWDDVLAWLKNDSTLEPKSLQAAIGCHQGVFRGCDKRDARRLMLYARGSLSTNFQFQMYVQAEWDSVEQVFGAEANLELSDDGRCCSKGLQFMEFVKTSWGRLWRNAWKGRNLTWQRCVGEICI